MKFAPIILAIHPINNPYNKCIDKLNGRKTKKRTFTKIPKSCNVFRLGAFRNFIPIFIFHKYRYECNELSLLSFCYISSETLVEFVKALNFVRINWKLILCKCKFYTHNNKFSFKIIHHKA